MDTYIFNIHDVVLLMTMTVCVLLALFQWALPVTTKHLASTLLISFLLITSAQSMCILVLWNDAVHIGTFFDSHIVPYLLFFAVLAKGPILFFYVLSLTQHSFSLKRKYLAHLAPIAAAWLCLAFFSIDSDDIRWRSATATATSQQIVNYLWHTSKIMPFIYGIAAVYIISRYYSKLKEQYSSIPASEPSWLSILTISFTFSWAFSIFVHISAQFLPPKLSDWLGISENYFIFILINGLFTYSLAYAHSVQTTKPAETIKVPIDDRPDESAIQKVKSGMADQKLFLEQNLNIEEFSTRIDLPVRDVSGVINKHFGTNFFEFMNSYRVNEAKRLLADPSLKDMTILDILLQAGFNSKSAFHRFFKRLVGMSPSEYRKQATQDSKAS
ncbi:helix-turn-helix domain-containing protein [Gilvimarinus polysaccharolyticus]|uniref:helix-turn-helix domain-containing protein n=1 Tax=Gilvimarinus polysaccharolyticus TaxID=863921 RepID=UPI0006736E7B|nr:AraC family transcriptional regulator [Gilvimarinus polysaccharolyticus]